MRNIYNPNSSSGSNGTRKSTGDSRRNKFIRITTALFYTGDIKVNVFMEPTSAKSGKVIHITTTYQKQYREYEKTI